MGRILDANLVRSAQSGDAQALRALIEATQNRLFRFCLVLCGDALRAEDLCQDVYLKVFDHLAKIEKPEAFIDWLFRTTRNLYLDDLRRHHETPMPSEEQPEIAVSGAAEHYAVHEALSQFETEDRWLILLIDMEGYSYKEAADHLALTEDAVRSRIFRLRKEFAEIWKKAERK